MQNISLLALSLIICQIILNLNYRYKTGTAECIGYVFVCICDSKMVISHTSTPFSEHIRTQ